MKGKYTEKIADWRNIIRGGSLENMEQFLDGNLGLIGGFLDERYNAEIISEHGSGKNARDYFIDKNQKHISLIMYGVPKNVVNLMIKNEDVLDLSPEDMAESYLYLVNEKGLGKTAAATIASLDYFGRGELGSLDVIANHFHIIKSAYMKSKVIPQSLLGLIRYRNLTKYPEARFALRAIEDYIEGFREGTEVA